LQGRPRTVFARALQTGNLVVAEGLARELGRISLAEALELMILIARKEPRRHPRVAARWLLRYLEDCTEATIDEAALVTACLAALAGDRYLPKELPRREQQAASACRVPRRHPGVANGYRFLPPQARLPAQSPLAPNHRVVPEGGKGKALRPPAARVRRPHRGDRLHRAQGIGAEVPCPSGHPTRMTAARAEADPLRVEGDLVRPVSHGPPQRRVARRRG